jgi:hypothetical protein
MATRRASSSSSEAETSPSTSRPDGIGPDLEKQETAKDEPNRSAAFSTPSHPSSTTRARITRTQTITRGASYRGRFTHPLAHVKTSDAEIVDFDGDDDPYRPINWPFRKKLITTFLYGLTTMGSTWASSVYSPAIGQISEEYHVGEEVGLLGLSFLLMGFGLGPLLWAPLSEV